MMSWRRWVPRCGSAPRLELADDLARNSRLRAIPAPLVAARALRLVEREVGCFVHAIQRRPVIRVNSDTDARAACEAVTSRRHRYRHDEAVNDAVTDVLDVRGRRIVCHQHREFVSTDSRDTVGLAH